VSYSDAGNRQDLLKLDLYRPAKTVTVTSTVTETVTRRARFGLGIQAGTVAALRRTSGRACSGTWQEGDVLTVINKSKKMFLPTVYRRIFALAVTHLV
jgi:hypothetical protein